MKKVLTQEARKMIRHVFYQKIDRKLSPQEQARAYADLACYIMELAENDPEAGTARVWWVDPGPTMFAERRCGHCGRMTRMTTAGCDHCDVEHK